MASRGRSARIKGITFELEVMHKFMERGFVDCKTSRNESRTLDAMNVDLCGLPINVQCKAVERLQPSIHEILSSMPADGKLNCIFHERNRKKSVVYMNEDDFFFLFDKVYGEDK